MSGVEPTQENLLSFLKIDFEKEEDIKKFKEFYDNIFFPSFPPVESVSYEDFLTIANSMNKRNDCRFYCVLSIYENEVIGGIIGDYIAETNCGYIQFIVVSPKKRRIHLGTKTVNYFIEVSHEIARGFHPDVSGVDYFFFEVEDPNKVEESDKDDSLKRLLFWKKFGSLKLDMEYIQPPSAVGNPCCNCLNLWLIPGDQKSVEKIPKELIFKHLKLLFEYDFSSVTGLKGEKELEEMKEKVKDKECILIINI